MVCVAQSGERQLVTLEVVGSKPITHPIRLGKPNANGNLQKVLCLTTQGNLCREN